MKALPDLTCTKVCKTLIKTGRCDDIHCKYAHSHEQLRADSSVPTQQPPPSEAQNQELLLTDTSVSTQQPPPSEVQALPLFVPGVTQQVFAQPTLVPRVAYMPPIGVPVQPFPHAGQFVLPTLVPFMGIGHEQREVSDFWKKPLKAEAIQDAEPTVIAEPEAEPRSIDECLLPVGHDSPSNMSCSASPRSPLERLFPSGALRRAKRSYGSSLALIQEDIVDLAEDSALAHGCWPPAPPGLVPEKEAQADATQHLQWNAGNTITQWTVKNTFIDVGPDEPMKIGLRTVKSAGGRLDYLCSMDSSDDEFASRFA